MARPGTIQEIDLMVTHRHCRTTGRLLSLFFLSGLACVPSPGQPDIVFRWDSYVSPEDQALITAVQQGDVETIRTALEGLEKVNWR
jgi:hypothetical protein